MTRYWLGPWEWDAATDGGFWRPPLQAVACLDLRSVAACGLAGGAGGFGLFVTDSAANLRSDYINLGTDPLANWNSQQRARWSSALALPQALTANNLRDAIWESLTIQADPIGDDRAPPIMPTTQRRLQLILGGQVVASKAFRLADAEATPVMDLLRREYRLLRKESLDGKHHDRFGRVAYNHYRKVLDYWAKKYGLNYRAFQPADLPDEGPVQHETTIADNFNRADADPLGSSSEGWSWTEVTGDADIVSNKAQRGSATGRSRAESDLSSSDMYSQSLLVTIASGAQIGVTARFSSSAEDCYQFRVTNSTNTYRLDKIVAGATTNLALVTATAVAGGVTAKLTVNGSSLDGLEDGVSKVTVTDTAIAGNTRAGIFQGTNSGNILDDFQAGDLAATGYGPLIGSRLIDGVMLASGRLIG